MKKVLYVLLPQFAEHELPYLTQPLRSDAMAMKENPKYENKIVAESMEPVEAISGFRVLPDYTFENIPDDYAALVLIGGYGWKGEAAERVAPLVVDAISKGRIVGALVAKGRLNGIQFDTLFTGSLYFEIARNAIETAAVIKAELKRKNYRFYIDSPTNQIFVVLENEQYRKLTEKVAVSFWEKFDDTHTVIRIATSWATTME